MSTAASATAGDPVPSTSCPLVTKVWPFAVFIASPPRIDLRGERNPPDPVPVTPECSRAGSAQLRPSPDVSQVAEFRAIRRADPTATGLDQLPTDSLRPARVSPCFRVWTDSGDPTKVRSGNR